MVVRFARDVGDFRRQEVKMKLIVTGGLGFIGSCFIRKYVNQHKMVCFDKFGYAANRNAVPETSDNFKVVCEDVCFPRWLPEECKDADFIIHFAAESHVDNSIKNPTPLVLNNIHSTQQMLEMSREFGVPMIYISTDEVYGEGEFTESSPYCPNNPYSASKAAGDLLCHAYCHTFGAKVIVTHCCNNFGPYQHQEKFLPTMLNAIKTHKAVPIYGNGKNIRDWIYVEDHCSAIHFLMKNGVFGEHYCIGARQPMNNLEMVERIFALTKEYNPTYEFVQDRPGHDLKYTIDPSKLMSLGWSPEFTFEEGWKKTIEYYLGLQE
jgi:dTDP-glucose 4,6-dehydratase